MSALRRIPQKDGESPMAEEVITKRTRKKKRKAPRDADYRAAWKACRKPWMESVPNDKPRVRGEPWSDWVDGEEIDMRAALDKLLSSGWTIQALKAYAYCSWRHLYGQDRYDHVTAFAWRWAVCFAGADIGGDASRYLTRFNANPEAFAHVK